MALYFTHRNGPILGAKTELLNLQCKSLCFADYKSHKSHIWYEQREETENIRGIYLSW